VKTVHEEGHPDRIQIQLKGKRKYASRDEPRRTKKKEETDSSRSLSNTTNM